MTEEIIKCTVCGLTRDVKEHSASFTPKQSARVWIQRNCLQGKKNCRCYTRLYIDGKECNRKRQRQRYALRHTV